VPVDGRRRREERAGGEKERREGPLETKEAAAVQLRNNQQKRKGVKIRLSSQREVVAGQLTWRRRLRNVGVAEMMTMMRRR
jgi:hypothetical protein